MDCRSFGAKTALRALCPAMTTQKYVLATLSLRPSFAHHHDAISKNRLTSGTHDPEKWCPVFGQDHAQKRGKRSAERRMPSMSADRRQVRANLRHSSATRLRALTLSSLPRLRGRVREGARPPFGAHACGTRHRLSPRWLSPRTGFPEDRLRECFARSAFLSSVKHAPCGPVFLPVDRGPRAARERMAYPRAGTAPRFRLSGLPFRKGALTERGGGYVTETGTDVKPCRHTGYKTIPRSFAR
jgi:hypothetical protein